MHPNYMCHFQVSVLYDFRLVQAVNYESSAGSRTDVRLMDNFYSNIWSGKTPELAELLSRITLLFRILPIPQLYGYSTLNIANDFVVPLYKQTN
jgi:hypothetical protein